MSREELAPPIMQMEPNRRYRVNLRNEYFANQYDGDINTQEQVHGFGDSYVEEDIYGEGYNDELDDEVDCQIEEIQNGIYSLAVPIATAFYGGIIGRLGSTIRRIKSETQCDIIIPSRTATQMGATPEIIFKAKTQNNILSARRKIQALVTSIRKKMKPTHFYGIALNFGAVKEKFVDLKKQILAAEIAGIEESLFQSEHCIHITFGVCHLMDDNERTKACETLQSCRELLNDLKPPFTIRVSGLEIMNDDPSSVHVLYAAVKCDELQEFANRCFQHFNKSGLSFDTFSRGCVNLHMTVMNNRYRTSNAKSFDGREILKRWSNFDFGTIECNELLLCAIKSEMFDKSTFYKITDSLKF